MSSVLAPLAPVKPRTRKPPARTIQLVERPSRDTEGYFAIDITVGRRVDRYVGIELPHCDGGRGFSLEKIDARCEVTATYEVLIASDGNHTCSCAGGTYHNHCKHAEGLAALIAAGHLPIVPAALLPPGVTYEVTKHGIFLVPEGVCPQCARVAPAGRLCGKCEREEPAFLAAHGEWDEPGPACPKCSAPSDPGRLCEACDKQEPEAPAELATSREARHAPELSYCPDDGYSDQQEADSDTPFWDAWMASQGDEPFDAA